MTAELGHRLVIDIQTTQSLRFSERGIPRYTADYARALLHAGAPVAGLMLNPLLPHPKRLPTDVARSPRLAWNTAQAFRALEAEGPLAYHVMSPLESPRPVQATLPPFVMGSGVALVCTVYDMIPEILKVFEPGTPFARLYALRREMLRRADLLFAISRNTRDDAIRLLGVDPERVVDIGTGASEFFHPPTAHDRPADLVAEHVPGVTRPFVLTVTGAFGLDNRKNTEGVIAAFAALSADLRAEHQLVVACTLNEDDEDRWQALAGSHGLRPGQVVFTGFVADVALRALYQRASVFVNASLYEGFGLPALEAARCGAPTITSNTSSLPEILDWPAATFDPSDTEDIARVLARALVDDGFRADLRAAGDRAARTHTWDRVAARAMEGYGRLDPPPTRTRRRRSTPLRIALVGPFPPSTSGTAVFNQRLAAVLAERCELDCFADGPLYRPPPAGRPFRIFPASSFGRFLSPYSYDAVFYALADDTRHSGTYELALCYPGILWLHDLHIAGLYLAFSHARFDDEGAREFMLNTLRHHYGSRAPEHLIDSDAWSSSPAYEEAGARLAGEVANRSRGAIVGSHAAAALLRADAGPFPRLPPTWVVPLPSPPVDDRLPPEPDAALVLGLGGTTPVVRPDLLVEALALVGAEVPAARLVFVGDEDPTATANLRRRIVELGIEDHVAVAGHVTPDAYRSWLDQAACAVHLRLDRSGATSLAISEALARGVPTVTTLSAYSELPAGTLEVLPQDARAGVIAAEIVRLLRHPNERDRLRRAAVTYARSHTYEAVADRVLEIAAAYGAGSAASTLTQARATPSSVSS
jgi:glycosyltransferase involved in cell wall biosynthesis